MSELGTRLKQARIERGYDLKDLQEITKIQKRYLAGIEEGDHSILPGPFYIRAFIKQYAEAVGMDAHNLLEEFGPEIPAPSNEEERAQLVASIPLNREAFTKSSVSRLGDMLPQIIVALFIIVTLLILVFFYSKNATNDVLEEERAVDGGVRYEEPADSGAASHTEEAVERKILGEESAEKAMPKDTDITLMGTKGENTTYTWNGSSTRKLKIEVSGKSWITVKDATQKELMLPREMQAGESETIDVSGLSLVRIRIDAVPNVTLTLNGDPIEYVQDRITQNIIIEFPDSQ